MPCEITVNMRVRGAGISANLIWLASFLPKGIAMPIANVILHWCLWGNIGNGWFRVGKDMDVSIGARNAI